MCLFSKAITPVRYLQGLKSSALRGSQIFSLISCNKCILCLGGKRGASTPTLSFHSHGTMGNSQSMLGTHLADCVIGGGWGQENELFETLIRGGSALWRQRTASMTSWPWRHRSHTVFPCWSLAEIRLIIIYVVFLTLWLIPTYTVPYGVVSTEGVETPGF